MIMKGKFMLIVPRSISPVNTIPRIHMPLGAVTVLSQAKEDGYEVKLLDTSICDVDENNVDDYFKNNARVKKFDNKDFWITGMSDDEIVSNITKFNPDVIGFSCCTVVDREDTKYLVDLVKDKFPDKKMFLGGYEIDKNYENILKKDAIERDKIDNIDCISLGLGQVYIDDILKYLMGESKEIPKGIAYRTEKGYEISGEKEYDINDYELPDYGLVEKVNVTGRDKPVDVYSFLGNTHAGDIKTLSKSDDKISYFPLFTSYGCGNNCTFCDADKKLQRYSFDNVKKMIKRYEDLYGIDYLDFMDNNFAGGNNESRKICFDVLDYIGKKGYPIGFSNGLTFESMMRNDFELFKKFNQYGNVAHLAFPCENANDRVLKMIRKPHNIEMISKTLKQAKELLPNTNKEAFFIGGFPDTFGEPAETPREVKNTVSAIERLIKNGYLDQAIFLTLSPVTAVYRKQWEEKNPNMSFVNCLFSKGTDIWPYDSNILEEAREKVKYINSQNSSKVTRRLYLSKEEEDKEKIENADINKKEEQDLER